MSPPFLQPELEHVLTVVRDCARRALAYQAGGPRVLAIRHKPLGGGPITAADRDVNDRLVASLHDRFPDDAILAEESPERPGWATAHRCWFIDPIDGTREFARGTAGWTVQVGLCIDGDPVLGVVAEPGQDRLSWAVLDPAGPRSSQQRDEGPSRPLQTSDRSFDDLRLTGGKLFPFSRQHAIRRALEVPSTRTTSVGSVGVRMTRVARGEADVYVQAPGRTKLWDTCAPAVLVLAAGGRVTDLRGLPLRYRQHKLTHHRGVVTATADLHPEVLRRIAPLADTWLRRES